MQELKMLEEEEIVRIYEERLTADFPPGEVKPLKRILELHGQGRYLCFGYYEVDIICNQNSDKAVDINIESTCEPTKENNTSASGAMAAYAFLAASNERDAVLLDYLAVDASCRSKGYGSRLLSLLKKEVQRRGLGNLILEVENPRFGKDEEEKRLRERRISFYQRNGMTLTPFRIFLYDVEYLVMTADKARLMKAGEELLHVYRVLLKPDKIGTRLRITSNIRCIAMDLDRTLLDENGALLAEDAALLAEASRKGIRLVAASGRAYYTFPAQIRELSCIDYCLTLNGAAVWRGGVCLRHRVFDKRTVDILMELYRKYKESAAIALEVFAEGRAYCEADYYRHPKRYGAEDAAAYVRATRAPMEDMAEFVEKNKAALESVDLIVADPEIRGRVKAELTKVGHISVTSAVERMVEIAPFDSTKEKALADILQETGIWPAECLAFGDGDNDAGMLRYAGVGVAVGNASQLAKNAADFVTKPYNRRGVGKIIEEILQMM